MIKKTEHIDPAKAPGHTDMMLPPEEIDRLFDLKRIATSLREFSEYLDGHPIEWGESTRDMKIAADILDGTI